MVISQPLYLDQKLSVQALALLDECWFPVIKKYYPDGENYGLVQRASVMGYCYGYRNYAFGIGKQREFRTSNI